MQDKQKPWSRNQRNIGLDIMRISLALLIFLFHFHMHFDCEYGVFNRFISMGAIAMTAFFMLSGYSLHITYKEKDIIKLSGYKKYLFKRFIGIFPLYYFVAIVYVFTHWQGTILDNVLLFPVEFLGLQSYFTSLFAYSHNGGTWFISCLTVCYLLYPFMEQLFKQMITRSKMLLILFFTFIMLISPIVQHEAHLASIYSNLFFRFIEFCIGLLIAQLNDEKKDVPLLLSFFQKSYVWVITFIVLIGGVTLATFTKVPKDYMLYSWIALPCFEVIFINFLGGEQICFENKSLFYCSKISYAFFMAQLFVWDILKWLFSVTEIPNINILRIIMSIVVCMGVSVILYEFIQKPIKNIFLNLYKK